MYWVIAFVLFIAMISMAYLFTAFLSVDRAQRRGLDNSTRLCAGLAVFFAVLFLISLTQLF